ncbi:hypothetical protein MC885_009643 [Smutsia gigantea]|nr:hypothetical protein MC885_009643 [Smutsia gigantea]
MLSASRSCRACGPVEAHVRKATSAACAMRAAGAREGRAVLPPRPAHALRSAVTDFGSYLVGEWSMFPRAVAGCGHGTSNCMREQPGETLTVRVSTIPAAATRLSYMVSGSGLGAFTRVQVFPGPLQVS